MDGQLTLPYPGQPPAAPSAAPDSDGMVRAISAYRRQAPLFLAILAVCVAAALAFSLVQTPLYTASASVMIAPHRAEVGADNTAVDTTDPVIAEANVDSQVEVLKSDLMARTVVDQLGLTHDRAFLDSLSPPSRIPFIAAPAPPAHISAAAAVEQLQKRLKIARVAQTLVIEIDVISPDRALAARVANAYAQAFVAQAVTQKLDDSRNADALLTAQLGRLRSQVEASATAVAQYRAAHNLLNVDGSTMAAQEITSLDTQVAANRASAAEAAARLSTARAQLAHGSHGDDLGESLNSPVIQELRKQREEASAKLADLQTRFGDRFPDVIAAKRQIADIDGQIDAEIRRIISNLDAQNRVAQQRVGSLVASVGAARGQLAANNTASVKLDELQRTADSERTLYEGVLNRVKETQTQGVTAQPDARVTDAAVLPLRPSSPKLAINLLLGVLLGTGLGVGVAILRQETDTGLRTLEDVENKLHLRYFGALPALDAAARRAAGSGSSSDQLARNASSSFAEAFRGMAAALVHTSGAVGPKVVALTSALPKEGKTTAAVCLGRVAAMEGLKVVLVDCDLRRPFVARTCRIAPKVGLLEVLRGRASLDEALVEEVRTGLSILPLVEEGRAARRLFESSEMDALLAELRSRFDLVLLDTSPVLPVIETRVLSRKADAVVLFVRWQKTPRKAVAMAAHLLRELGVKIAGAALTQVDLKAQARSGYGDPTFYYPLYKGCYVQ